MIPLTPAAIFDVAGGELYFSVLLRDSPGQLLTKINLATFATSDTISTGSLFQSVIDFDVSDSQTFACNFNNSGDHSYTIDR